MGGVNPYIQRPDTAGPARRYTITFLPMNVTVEVDPNTLPADRDGEPGSILRIALERGINIDHACGGVCACSTCHVLIKEGFHSLNEALDDEEDQLENAPGLRSTSRLACQAVPSGRANVVVEIPDWNRNLVQEEH